MGSKGGKEWTVISSVGSERLSDVWENHSGPLAKLRVLLFCMKYPKLKFTAEWVAVNQGIEEVVLEGEIQNLINEGILGEQTSGTGITYYCLNRTQQELVELTESFLRDLHLHGSSIRTEGD